MENNTQQQQQKGTLKTCKKDTECPSKKYCVPKDLENGTTVNVCATATPEQINQKFGVCSISENLNFEKTELIPKLEASRSKCLNGTSMTVDWGRPSLDCRCCIPAAGREKQKCGLPTPIRRYETVLFDNLRDASKMF
jgi:hypothetical protein